MFSISVIIETPRQTAGKYVFDPANQIYKLKKVLPLGMHFPYDFGLIENTHAQDGDPADAIVFTECITYPGVRLICGLIGALQVKQTQSGISVRNDRYFVIPEDSIMFEHIKEIKDFSRVHNQQLRDFFINYTKAENKKLSDLKFINAENAKKRLQKINTINLQIPVSCKLFVVPDGKIIAPLLLNNFYDKAGWLQYFTVAGKCR